jgi:hypothetical protein
VSGEWKIVKAKIFLARLYRAAGNGLKQIMRGEYLIWLALGLAMGLVLWTSLTRFSPGARLRRRLRKTHSRIVSKARQPSVKFSVKPPKEK